MTNGTPSEPDDIQRILRERAEALAAVSHEADDVESRSMVVLALGNERYAIDIGTVREIAAIDTITPMPAVPAHWLGLVNVRGELFPVLDLRRYLGLPEGTGETARWMVVVGGAHSPLVLAVDEVLSVRSIPVADIGPSLADARGASPAAHIGLTKDFVVILDVDAIVNDPALVVNDSAD